MSEENPYLKKLVELYSNHSVTDVETKPELTEAALGAPVETLRKDDGFAKMNNFVKELRRDFVNYPPLQTAVGSDLVAKCLWFLLSKAISENRENKNAFDLRIATWQALLLATYGKKWSLKQQEHFNFWAEHIKSWNSYFLSYTNPRTPEINNDFEDVIRYILPQQRIEKMKWDEDNLVAETIIHKLAQEGLTNGFYDKTRIQHGDNLEKVIGPACKDTFAFVQLVHKETFSSRADNWCYFEYTIFSTTNRQLIENHKDYENALDRRFRAVLAGESETVFPALVKLEFEPWQEEVRKEKHYKKLSRNPEEFKTVISQIAAAIVGLKKELLESVPAG